MQYVGQTNNIRLRMNGHKSDYRKFPNGDFSKSGTSSLYSHLKSHDVKILKFQILEILENEGFIYTKDIRQLETSLDAKKRHWIWKLETLTPKGLNVADAFHSQNRSSRKKRSRFFTLVWLTHKYIYICVYLCVDLYVCVCMCIHKLPSILLFRLFSSRSLLRSFYSTLPALYIVFPHNRLFFKNAPSTDVIFNVTLLLTFNRIHSRLVLTLLNCFTSCVQGLCVTRKLNLILVYWVFALFCAVPSMILPFWTMYIYIYIVVFDVDVWSILHVTLCEFHIHGVICMIVRHKENVLGSATYSDFYVDWGQFTCDYMLLFQIVCLIIGTVFFRCVSIFDMFPLGINYIGLTVFSLL